MNKSPIYDGKCPVINVLNIVGGKWRLPIIWHLKDEGMRYNELKRQITGITNIMLTRSLRDLEEAGLIHRIQYSTVPPHVEYRLTERAHKLVPAIDEIRKWGLMYYQD